MEIGSVARAVTPVVRIRASNASMGFSVNGYPLFPFDVICSFLDIYPAHGFTILEIENPLDGEWNNHLLSLQVETYQISAAIRPR